MAERVGLNPIQCGFESHDPYGMRSENEARRTIALRRVDGSFGGSNPQNALGSSDSKSYYGKTIHSMNR
jgi:hypothetical protein